MVDENFNFDEFDKADRLRREEMAKRRAHGFEAMSTDISEEDAQIARERMAARRAMLADPDRNKQILQNKLKKIMFNNSLFGENIRELNTMSLYHVPKGPYQQQYSDIQMKAFDFIDDIENGENYYVIMYGDPGTGKTYLSHSILATLLKDNKTVLFLNTSELVDLIFASWRDARKAHKLEKIKKYARIADLLILDDLGTESSNGSNVKEATQSIQRFLYDISNSRQGKSTIITTNESIDRLRGIYNPKLISRMIPQDPERIWNFAGFDDLRHGGKQ